MLVIGLDPGPDQSAAVIWNGRAIAGRIYDSNAAVMDVLLSWAGDGIPLVIEKIASFGMPVGAEVFETVFWSGRFAQAYGIQQVDRITRGEVKMHLCHSMRAKDGNIRQALIDRYGAVGTKRAPGVLYGVSGDLWSALAVAVTYWDRQHAEKVA